MLPKLARIHCDSSLAMKVAGQVFKAHFIPGIVKRNVACPNGFFEFTFSINCDRFFCLFVFLDMQTFLDIPGHAVIPRYLTLDTKQMTLLARYICIYVYMYKLPYRYINITNTCELVQYILYSYAFTLCTYTGICKELKQ